MQLSLIPSRTNWHSVELLDWSRVDPVAPSTDSRRQAECQHSKANDATMRGCFDYGPLVAASFDVHSSHDRPKDRQRLNSGIDAQAVYCKAAIGFPFRAGVGSAIGSQIGGALGAPLGPVTYVIGRLLGGMAGAMVGRVITNEIKLAPLRKAHENLVVTVETAKATISRSQEETRQKLAAAAEEAGSRLEAGMAAIRESCQRELDARRGSLRSRMEAFSRDFPGVLRQVRALLIRTRDEGLAQLPRSNMFTRYIWPTYAGVAHRVVANWFGRRLAFLDRSIVRFERLARDSRLSPQEKLARIRQFVLDHPALYGDLERLAADLSAEYERAVAES